MSKRNWLLQRIQRITTAVLLTVVWLACATVVSAQGEPRSDKWQFTISPYVWLPSISGSMQLEAAPGFGSGSVDISPSTYLDYLNLPLMVDFRIQKGKWSIMADTIYLDFSGSQSAHYPGILPVSGGWTTDADWDLKSLFIQPAVAYSVFRNKHLNFDLLAGVRYSRIDGKVELDLAGPLPEWVRSKIFAETENYIDPIVGFKGQFELSEKLYLPYNFDIGGFGIDSDLTLGARMGIGYHFVDWFSLGIDYRYMYHDFADPKLVEDLNLYGPSIVLGFTF